MNKRKTRVCTVLFVIVVCVLYIGSMLIKNKEGMSLYELIQLWCFPFLCGRGIGKLTIRFNEWLTKETKE